MNPLSRNTRDWLYALALMGLLLRVSMPLWALPQVSQGGFMLMCTSHGQLWQIDDQGDAHSSQQLPCMQCGVHLVSVQSFPFTPPAPLVASTEQRPRFAEALGRQPPFLVAPPGRAPPAFS